MGVTRAKIETEGYITWEEHHIATFEAHHPIGSRARRALALLLGTGQRRSDIVTMGRQHVRGDKIRVKQSKTGKTLMIPIGDELRAAIEATPADHLTFLTTARGKPFTATGFTNWFRDMCNEAGLPNGLSAHGLRKAMCRRLRVLKLSFSIFQRARPQAANATTVSRSLGRSASHSHR